MMDCDVLEGVREEGEAGWIRSGENLNMVCWNVCDMRAEVIDYYRPDVIALVETWLKGKEEIMVEGYRWFGCNRRTLHRKAVQGSGGVGVLIRQEVLKEYAVEVLDSDVDDVLWLRLSNEEEEEGSLVLAVCYLPPETSSRGMAGGET